jgi:hypothetical protein
MFMAGRTKWLFETQKNIKPSSLIKWGASLPRGSEGGRFVFVIVLNRVHLENSPLHALQSNARVNLVLHAHQRRGLSSSLSHTDGM